MQPREFHIWDFPENKIRILFRRHQEFIQKAIKYFNSRNSLSKYLGISSQEVYSWAVYQLYIPLKYVKLIAKKLKLNLNILEKDIISYKGINTSTPIFNPKLPVKESPEIFSIITHIICDGSVNKNGIPMYINSNKILIDNLNFIIKKNFGNFKENFYFGTGINKNCYQYRFPKIIIEIIEYIYNINFHKKKEIPSEIFKLPVKFSIAVIKAFADDEGSVDLNRRIGIVSINKDLLIVLIKLLNEKLKFSYISNILEKNSKPNKCYCFYIRPREIEKYQKIIGFNHPDKTARLNSMVRYRRLRQQERHHGKVGETREKLLNLLNDRILSTYDIMKELKINKSNINSKVKQLKDTGVIIQHHKTGQTVFWTTNKNGIHIR